MKTLKEDCLIKIQGGTNVVGECNDLSDNITVCPGHRNPIGIDHIFTDWYPFRKR